jgi:hypothetical protein
MHLLSKSDSPIVFSHPVLDADGGEGGGRGGGGCIIMEGNTVAKRLHDVIRPVQNTAPMELKDQYFDREGGSIDYLQKLTTVATTPSARLKVVSAKCCS